MAAAGFFSLPEWSLTICLTPYNRKLNVLSASLNKTFPSFLLSSEHSLQGFVYYQGPAYLRNAYFTNYEEQIWNGRFRPAGAISFRKSNTYPTTSQSHVFGITFGFCDKVNIFIFPKTDVKRGRVGGGS